MDSTTAERLNEYHQYLSGQGWTRLRDKPNSVLGTERQVYKFTLDVTPNHCYVVLVLGGPGVQDADIGVFESENTLSKDIDEDRDAVATFCIASASTTRVSAMAYKGAGPLFLVAYETAASESDRAWPSWSGARPKRPNKISRHKLEATELYALASKSVFVVASGTNMGSAVAISNRHLITNCHVLAGTNDAIMLKQGRKIALAYLVRADREGDRCLLTTEDLVLRPVNAVRSFSDLKIGESVFAIGTPGGQEGSLSDGIISRFDRHGAIPAIQTTAPISPGSSGGPLFDAAGNLIGITTFQRTDGQNMNFALAADSWWE
jgi:S1-C subfamily serine protease